MRHSPDFSAIQWPFSPFGCTDYRDVSNQEAVDRCINTRGTSPAVMLSLLCLRRDETVTGLTVYWGQSPEAIYIKLYRGFLVLMTTQSCLQFGRPLTLTHTYTHIHTCIYVLHFLSQLDLGFSILSSKDTWACRMREKEIEPPSLWSVDDRL